MVSEKKVPIVKCYIMEFSLRYGVVNLLLDEFEVSP